MYWRQTGFVLLTLLMSGCMSGLQVDVIVQESAQGQVYLDRIPDRQFQATHPIRLDQGLIASSLQGIRVHEETGLLRAMGMTQTSTVPAFSWQDIAFLAPAITDALRRAAADQQIGFRLIQRGERGYGERAGAAVGSSEPPLRLSPEETTTGSVFAYGHSLFITLTEYRQRRDNPDTVNMPNRRLPQPSGQLNRQLTFAPAEALRSNQFAPAFLDDPTNVLIIDYEALAKLPLPSAPSALSHRATESLQPSPTTQPAGSGAADSELHTIKEEMKKRDSEVEELKKELQDIKRQLGSRQNNRGATPFK
ncbi:exported hypothetical protein [Nitrospira sp. ND1]|uniref:hypothetical protein n=1 Tax=Nitrospira sp. ND1 TaxID=1658518 RepID=UPI0009B98DA0|nr:hypothetical protein [Nitrospira sp. ND1]SLM43154.1 exported hypothetical protein [Nitrospira sp. ND1]